MNKFVRPNVVVSKCLGFENCRYNGQTIPDDFVDDLEPYVNYRTVCPEVEIGLGAPRNPIRLVMTEGEPRLMQPATKRDVTEAMRKFTASFLTSLDAVDGFILKNRSPSCGMGDVRIYTSIKKGASATRGQGAFGGVVLERFSHLAVEDEGRLRNFRIREHFLTKLFARARFRRVKQSREMGELVQFHTRNKLLLMSYKEPAMRAMGRIVANPDQQPFNDVIIDYEQHLSEALADVPSCLPNINVLMHALGHVSDKLTSEEKAFFLDYLERYREGTVPLSTLIGLMQSWIVRFENVYLAQQTFFRPYPEPLIALTDSGKEMACLLEGKQ
jgi:uncharacterized protein YbgA (DUF1722 family)/uncharacterized protein YbbK (DUF523 family)